jgi:hypothetical protein
MPTVAAGDYIFFPHVFLVSSCSCEQITLCYSADENFGCYSVSVSNVAINGIITCSNLSAPSNSHLLSYYIGNTFHEYNDHSLTNVFTMNTVCNTNATTWPAIYDGFNFSFDTINCFVCPMARCFTVNAENLSVYTIPIHLYKSEHS